MKGSAYSFPAPKLRQKQGQSSNVQHLRDKNKPALRNEHTIMKHMVHNPYLKSLGPKYVSKSRLLGFRKAIQYLYQIFQNIPSRSWGSSLKLNILIFLHVNMWVLKLQRISKLSSSYSQTNFSRVIESIILRDLWIWGLQKLGGGWFLVQSPSSKAIKPKGVQKSSTTVAGGQGWWTDWMIHALWMSIAVVLRL